ncbi:Wzy polymerase domain-containing protein [Dryocola sp. BD626]|uniref:PglL family O-oligosaccharyltransferase n=1 Tax=Dryocola sp. BD626 TaxID=3133273 RepID=UPI003F4FB674
MTKPRIENRVRITLVLSLAILGMALISWPWPTLPGTGLNLTRNLLTWMWCSVLCLGLVFATWHRPFHGVSVSRWVVAGALLMSLPLAWTAPDFTALATYRLAGIWALAGLFLLLLQFPARGGMRRAIYTVIILAGIVQTLLAFGQILAPNLAAAWLNYDFIAAEGRPLGTLNQVNLLASFIATALLCAVWLSMTIHGRAHALLMFATIILAAGLTVTQARAIYLGAAVGLGVLLIFGSAWKNDRKFILLALAAGIAIGQIGLELRPDSLAALPSTTQTADARPAETDARLDWNKRRSNGERLTLLKGAWDMIETSPLLGSGLETFETAFPQTLADMGMDNPFTVTAIHPHNELLYAWAEGGVAALAGLLIWLGVWAQPFRSLLTAHRRSDVIARGALAVPLMAHVMSEFPLYFSAIHAVTLIVLLWLALPASLRKAGRSNKQTGRRLFYSATVIVCLLAFGFMATGLQSSARLREAESFSLMDQTPLTKVLNPFAQPERLQFDWAVSDLMQFNLTRNADWLSLFQQQARRWLINHNDDNLTASMMKIAAYKNDTAQVKYWRQRGCLSFRMDPRFSCESLNSEQSGEIRE